MNGTQAIALVGSILLSIGVFFPILEIPMIGNVSYFSEGEGLGFYVLIVGVIALGLSFTKQSVLLLLSGITGLGFVAYSLIVAAMGLDNANRHYEESAYSALSGGMEVTLSFGWIVMIAGAVMIIIGSLSQMGGKKPVGAPVVEA